MSTSTVIQWEFYLPIDHLWIRISHDKHENTLFPDKSKKLPTQKDPLPVGYEPTTLSTRVNWIIFTGNERLIHFSYEFKPSAAHLSTRKVGQQIYIPNNSPAAGSSSRNPTKKFISLLHFLSLSLSEAAPCTIWPHYNGAQAIYCLCGHVTCVIRTIGQ